VVRGRLNTSGVVGLSGGLSLAQRPDMLAQTRGGWLAAIAALLILGAPASAQDEDQPEVVQLHIRGVQSVDMDELKRSIVTEESRCRGLFLRPICWFSKSPIFYERNYLDRAELERDVVRIRVFYWKRGFRDAQVDTTILQRGSDRAEVTLAISEGPPTLVSRVDVAQTEEVLARRDIARALALHEGAPLNLLRLDTTRVRLEQGLWSRGYADAVVDTAVVLSEDETSAVVTFTLDPRWLTTIEEIHVHENDRISEGTIRRSLTFREGDIFRLSDLLRSQRKLYESNLFRRAVIEPSIEGGFDSAKVVDITVTEAPLREARLSLGFNTVDFVQTEARFTHYNFRGGARRLTAQAAVGNLFASALNDKLIFVDVFTVPTAEKSRYLTPTYNASLELRQPWFGSARNNMAVSAFTHRRSAPGIYVDRSYGSSVTFTRELTDRAPASANYRFEVTSVEAGDVYFCVSYGVCDGGTLDALRGHQRLSPLAITATMDRTDDPLGPTRGMRAHLDVEHAAKFTMSDYRYNRATAEFAIFRGFRSRGVLAGRIRAGWVGALPSTGLAFGGEESREILHPRKRFYAGGAQSVRGYGENQLGPRVLTISRDRLRTAFTVVEGDTIRVCPDEVPIQQCDPQAAGLRDRDFEPRPLGGNQVAEVTAELRFPLWKQLTGAVFVDAGHVLQRTDRTLPRSQAAVTPGFGVRYESAVGPIRVDLGINPAQREQLPVITETFVDGERRLVRLDSTRDHSIARSGFAGVLDRIRLHLSIGEAF
jgi:outer membrane protein assembly factor BamA